MTETEEVRLAVLLTRQVADVHCPADMLGRIRADLQRRRRRVVLAAALFAVALGGGTAAAVVHTTRPPRVDSTLSPAAAPTAPTLRTRGTSASDAASAARSASFTLVYLPAGYSYQEDRGRPPGRTAAQWVERSWVHGDTTQDVLDVLVQAGPSADDTAAAAAAGSYGPVEHLTVRGHPAVLTAPPTGRGGLRFLTWNEDRSVSVRVTDIRGTAPLDGEELQRVAAGLLLNEGPAATAAAAAAMINADAEQPGPHPPAAVPSLGEVVDTHLPAGDAPCVGSDGRAAAQLTRVLWLTPFRQPGRPLTTFQLVAGTASDNGQAVPAGGVNGLPAEPEGSQLTPGFHALVPAPECLTSTAATTMGWVVGPVARVTATPPGRPERQVPAYPWSASASLQLILADVVTRGTLFRAYDCGGMVVAEAVGSSG